MLRCDCPECFYFLLFLSWFAIVVVVGAVVVTVAGAGAGVVVAVVVVVVFADSFSYESCEIFSLLFSFDSDCVRTMCVYIRAHTNTRAHTNPQTNSQKTSMCAHLSFVIVTEPYGIPNNTVELFKSTSKLDKIQEKLNCLQVQPHHHWPNWRKKRPIKPFLFQQYTDVKCAREREWLGSRKSQSQRERGSAMYLNNKGKHSLTHA